MNNKPQKMILITILACLIGFSTPGLPVEQTNPAGHQPLSYDIEVNAYLLPIYAIDANGNPVYDLKAEDIELFINKKSFSAFQFLAYQAYQSSQEKKETGKIDISATGEVNEEEPAAPIPLASGTGIKGEEKGPLLAKESPERINFIIIDGISNSKIGIRHALKLVIELINSGGPMDWFILLRSDPYSGLTYLIGPEKDKTKLLNQLEKISKDPDWDIMNSPRSSPGIPGLAQMVAKISKLEQADAIFGYRRKLVKFGRSLQELKYALKTIRYPKTIFLVSGGIQGIAGNFTNYGVSSYYDQSNSSLVTYYEEMKQAAIDINKGGALLYLVNPIPETLKIRNALNIMSRISNAKAISANETGDLLTHLKNNTAAYYELAFVLPQWCGENFKIKVKCKRSGVTLNTLTHGEKTRPYMEMEKVQKELFALNVITGGSWSRMVGTVKPTLFQDSENTTGNSPDIKKISVDVPTELKGQKVDVFILNVNPKSLKTNFHLEQRHVDETGHLEMEVKVITGKDQYIVIIEPKKTFCVYTRVTRAS